MHSICCYNINYHSAWGSTQSSRAHSWKAYVTLMYGLLSFHDNYFLLLNKDYNTIKLVQFITGSQIPTSCVNFDIYECRPNSIRHDNRFNWAASPRLSKFFEPDKSQIKLTKDDHYIGLREEFGLAELTDAQKRLSENFYFLCRFLTEYNVRIDLLSERRQKALDQKIGGVEQFSKFLLLQTGPDPFVSLLTKNESERIRLSSGAIENHKRQLFKVLMNTNFKEVNPDHIVSRIQYELRSFQHILAGGNERQSKVVEAVTLKALNDARKRNV